MTSVDEAALRRMAGEFCREACGSGVQAGALPRFDAKLLRRLTRRHGLRRVLHELVVTDREGLLRRGAITGADRAAEPA
jgi:hypothetical protein